MQPSRARELLTQYRTALTDDVLAFWLRHSLDETYGGYLNGLDRQGEPYDAVKSGWLLARQVWMFSTVYRQLEARTEWLRAARHGYAFMREHAYNREGRMYFSLTRDGSPLRMRRYLFTEAFGVIACAAYSLAAGDEEALEQARRTYKLILRLKEPGMLPPKFVPEAWQAKTLAMPMMMLAITQELRAAEAAVGNPPDELYAQLADAAVREITQDFWRADRAALMENVGPNGEPVNGPPGRCVNPGHSIEVAWFLLHEAQARDDATLQETALAILDGALALGWDPEHGGLLSFVDIEGRPPAQVEWDMKYWWPHTEALYATLLAHQLTGDARYEAWFETMHDWTWRHFPDPTYGEWYGYLHRDGTVALDCKGGAYKGCFHVPRALWLCGNVLEEMV